MNVEIINIGDELLIGQVVNTNASWIGVELNNAGINVCKITTIADDALAIRNSVDVAIRNSDCVLITGGLGPTKDDITKRTLAAMFESELIENKEVLDNIMSIFSKRGYELTPTNRMQALVPEQCRVIPNPVGTAAGMCFERDNKLIFSMPGVPFEMKDMMKNYVIPMLKDYYKPQAIVHKTIITQGIGESFLSDMIEEFELALPSFIKLAYLPSANMLRLRLSARGEDEVYVREQLDKQIDKLIPLIKNYFVSFDKDNLSLVLADLLESRDITIASAESCTGGNIAHLITSNAGASKYYKGSVIAYSNQIKIDMLGVNEETLKKFGAVSKEVAMQMAKGVCQRLNVDYAVSTTGIAGPEGGSEEKPIGTVWVAIADKKGECIAHKYNFASSRGNFIDRVSNEALALLIRNIEQN